ncbi:MAG: hypothetical protein K2X29_06115 [Candidatus Obscuribacterales bacterium]|nr:hypothetical protein [Candidatus Obscuribacterales bacterium]
MNKRVLTLAIATSMTLMSQSVSLAATGEGSQKIASASTHKAHHAKASLLIKATPEQVWHAILDVPESDDMAYSKQIERKGNVAIIEEKYVKLPIIGEAIAVIKQTEDPFKRIDFELVRSDKFKAMEGSWVLTPMDNGKHTLVELSSYTDAGVPIPRFIIDITTKQRVKGRLQEVQAFLHKAQHSVSTVPGASK